MIKKSMKTNIKKSIKRSLCIILVAAMTFSLASCKKSRSTNNTSGLVNEASDANNSKESVYRFDTSVDFGKLMPNYYLVNKDKVVYLTTYYDPEWEEVPEDDGEGPLKDDLTEEVITEGEQGSEEIAEEGENAEGENTEEVASDETTSEEAIPEEESEGAMHYIAWAVGDSSGNVGDIVEFGYFYPNDHAMNIEAAGFSPDGNLLLAFSDYDFATQSYKKTLKQVTLDGKELMSEELKAGSSDNVDKVCISGDGVVSVLAGSKLFFFDESAKEIGSASADFISILANVISLEDGRHVLFYSDSSYKNMIREVNITDGTLGKEIAFPREYGYQVRAGIGHDFNSEADSGLYALDLKNDTITGTLILNYLDSDLCSSDISETLCLDDSTVLIVGNSDTVENGIYKKVPPEEVKEKIIITLGSLYDSYEVKKRVLDYNKKNDTYRIRMVSYEQYYSEDNTDGPEKQFRNDILAKSAPDIIITSDMSNPSIYMDKGLFADLYPLMEKNGINKEDYLSNVFEAGSRNGELYILIPSYQVRFVAMKESLLGGKAGLSVKEIMELEKKYNCVGSSVPRKTRDELLSEAMTFTANSYYDLGTGECHFDSEDFINTLEWVKTYPAEFDEDIDYFEDQKNSERGYHDNTKLMYINTLFNFREFNETEQINFGESTALTGFPGSADPGSGLIDARLGIAISAQSKNQDAAFDFVKYYFSDEYQMPDETRDTHYSFPISIKALDKMAEIESEMPFYYDSDTGKKEYNDEYMAFSYLKDNDVPIQPLSAESAEKVKNFIKNTTNFTNYDKKVIEIVKEEAAPFFDNQKSAADTAKIIQSRVTIYVRENQ